MNYKSGLIPIMIAITALLGTACAAQPAEEPPVQVEQEQQEQDDLTLKIDGSTLIPDVTSSLHFDYMEGITVRQALESSQPIRLTNEGKGILSVGDVALDSTLEWGVKLNKEDLKPEKWNTKLKKGDVILVYVKTVDSEGDLAEQGALILTVNNGLMGGERLYFVKRYEDNITVRDLLRMSGIVKLNVNNKQIIAVNGHQPGMHEKWILKVNHKVLMENGLEMRLRPHDNVQLELIRM
ncbi:hypothetical protein [Paenibacillus ihumii]|uniref:hypothetical protein n=1 Tax=Paenibacillus ihumii TaxID=687436 RepID=UPI0006D85FA4|nr:hypothetical protein [Paenibacillus ihumii]